MYIKTYGQLIETLTTMAANLAGYAGDLGTTVADQTFLDNSVANLNYMQNYCEVIDDNKKAYTAMKQRLFNGDGGVITPGPSFELYDPPFLMNGDVHGGTMQLIQRIKASPNYTFEIGVALGIDGAPQTIDEGTIKPTIEVHAAQSGYLFSVVVAGRGNSDIWDVLVAKVGTATYTVVKSAPGKSTDVIVQGDAENPGPIQLMVRVQLRRGNNNYGIISDIVLVTVNP